MKHLATINELKRSLYDKARDFATEMTSHNVLEKDLRGTKSIGDEHMASNKAVRKSMLQRGIKPEGLPPGEDVNPGSLPGRWNAG
jgi:hypothetical protein